MTDRYRVEVFLVGFDEDRAPELKQLVRIYNPSLGAETLRGMLRKVHEGERVLVYSSNNDTDAIRVAQALARGGANIEIDNLQDEEAEF